MGQLLVRKLDDDLIAKIRARAAENGVSVEEEHRRILRSALDPLETGAISFLEHMLQIPVSEEDSEELFERDRSIPDRATPIEWEADFSAPSPIVAEEEPPEK